MDAARSEDRKAPQLPCIWMLAGVLSYRLCDRNYDCEHCELHHALSGDSTLSGRGRGVTGDTAATSMQRSHAWGTAVVGPYLSHLLSGCRLYLDRPYCPPHFWLEQTTESVVTVGLDGTLVRLLQPVKRVVIPSPGIRLDRNQPCGWIAREHIAVPLRMPIAGEVIETNERYADVDQPSTLSEQDDWLFRVRPTEEISDVDTILAEEGTLEWYAERLGVVRRYLMAAILPDEPSVLGPVLADGGVPELRLEEVLGKESYRNLIQEIAIPSPVR